MTIDQYREVLKASNLDNADDFIRAMRILIEMERQWREYEEDMNQLDKQEYEAWFHQQDQEMSDEC